MGGTASSSRVSGKIHHEKGSNPTASDTLSLEKGCIIDNYHIKLTTTQMAHLFDIMSAKKTLTWKTVVNEKEITFRKCVDVKIDIVKLYNMQPDIEEWIRYDRAVLKDCKDMELWRPNPFYHFKCHIGDLIIQQQYLPPQILINGGVKFNILRDRYGLTPEIMAVLKYTPEEWVKLGLDEAYLDAFDEKQWKKIFNNLKKSEVAAVIRYFNNPNP